MTNYDNRSIVIVTGQHDGLKNIKGEVKMIKEIIKKVENGELELATDYDFHEVEYIDGPADVYIKHEVEDTEIDGNAVYLLFPETDARKEFRTAYDNADEEKKGELLSNYHLNDLDDEYDYFNAVGYDIGYGVVFL